VGCWLAQSAFSWLVRKVDLSMSDIPQLHVCKAALRMNSVGNLPPAGFLLLNEKARYTWHTIALSNIFSFDRPPVLIIDILVLPTTFDIIGKLNSDI
jgi:hypothetical protein